MNKSIFAVIVIYNINIKNSNSCNSLLQIGHKNILVLDNSTGDYNNRASCNQYGWHYINMHGNKGLSKAYNAAVGYLINKTDYIVLLDDDTILSEDFFKALKQSIEVSPDAKIFLPTVKDEAGILSPCRVNEITLLSPCRLDNFDVSRIKTLSEINEHNITGINSGMAISMDIFSTYRYDETYFLDYIDHAFLRDMKKFGNKITTFPSILHQKYSGNDLSNVKNTLVRFKIFKKDFKYFHNKSLMERFKTSIFIIRYRLALCRRFKTFLFLWA